MQGKRKASPVPTESQEQQCLFRWVACKRVFCPELDLLYHVPNGGSRRKSEAGRFKAEGVKAGVPDLFLPVALGGYHGMYIELKRQKGGRTSPEQERWIEALKKQGYFVALCRGWESAAKLLLFYLSLPPEGKAILEGRIKDDAKTVY